MKKLNVIVVPTWLPTGKDKLMGIYHQVFCEALNEDQDINANILYIDRQRLINPIKYIFMKKFVIEEKSKEDKDAQLKKATDFYSKNTKPGSIASKANMVKQYNEKNNK